MRRGHLAETDIIPNKMINKKGELIGSYDKTFVTKEDIDIGCIAGSRDDSNIKPVETEFGPVGMLICYDVQKDLGERDHDLILLYAERGARLVLVSSIGDYTAEVRDGGMTTGIWTVHCGQDSYKNDGLYKSNITDPYGKCVAGVAKQDTGLRSYCSTVINLKR